MSNDVICQDYFLIFSSKTKCYCVFASVLRLFSKLHSNRHAGLVDMSPL